MTLRDFLSSLGYTEKAYHVFAFLYQYGPKPISTIAAHIGCDRTYCYKLLTPLVQDSLLLETTIAGVKHIYIPDRDVLLRLLEKKRHELDRLQASFPEVEQELLNYDHQAREHLPHMVIFDKKDALLDVYEDIQKSISNQGLIAVKFFVSSTFSDQVELFEPFSEAHKAFIHRAMERNLCIDAYLAQGILTLDHISHTQTKEKLLSLTPGKGTTHGYLCGSTLYIIQFKEFPIAFKLRSFDMTDLLHFVFEQVGK